MTYREYYRRYLPHWQPPDAILFVTFRLAGSLPQPILVELRKERLAAKGDLARITDKIHRERQDDLDDRRAFGRWDDALHLASGSPRWLAQPEVAGIVAEALHYRDGKSFDLLAYCIMPNHVHVVFVGGRIGNPANADPIPLQTIMQSLKRHTARQANLKLGRQGAFWQEENFDHVIRDNRELERVIRYVIQNPVKAGLVDHWEDWSGTYCSPDCQSGLLGANL